MLNFLNINFCIQLKFMIEDNQNFIFEENHLCFCFSNSPARYFMAAISVWKIVAIIQRLSETPIVVLIS